MKAIVAMSGGVDSSVAAYLLKKQGLKVVGLTFEMWDRRDVRNLNVCCSVETIEIAKAVAGKLGIEHYIVDVRDSFYRYVIENFSASYIDGMTPNPCILCNKYIKFKFLLEKAEEIGAEIIATGHYARIDRTPSKLPAGRQNTDNRQKTTDNGRILLKKGVDPKKDQSYVLYVMSQEELLRTAFPLGELNKQKTREIAGELGLASALRSESQEICFVGSENYTDFIKGFAPEAVQSGPIVNVEGKIVGTHKGIAFYTIGQRKRLGISTLKPCYVVDIDRQSNTIIIGGKEDAMKKTFKVKELNWVSIESLSEPIRARVKIRSTMKEEPSTIIPEGNQAVLVEFDELQWAPAPGQSAVFYNGNVVIGGGIIECNPSVTGGDCCHSGLSGIALQEGFPTCLPAGRRAEPVPT